MTVTLVTFVVIGRGNALALSIRLFVVENMQTVKRNLKQSVLVQIKVGFLRILILFEYLWNVK